MSDVSSVFTSIDLFAGAGGLTGGLERAGFRTLAVVENDPDALGSLIATKDALVDVPGQGYKYLQGTRILGLDVAEVSGADLLKGTGIRRDGLTLLSGGPPCQPFSSAGKQLALSDPRGVLFKEFVRLAEELSPQFILLENVKGIVTAKTSDGRAGGVLKIVQESFEEIGYGCSFSIVNSADYGAPQRRERLIMMASRRGALPAFPESTHERPSAQTSLLGLAPWISLRQVVEMDRGIPDEDFFYPKGKRANELLNLTPGTGLRSGGIVEANRPGGHWGYRQDCFVADLSLPARTIRAAATPDWVEDPKRGLRRLHWRECADIQGFDGNWVFRGTVASKFRQIGNAVEGRTADAIGRSISTAARSRSGEKPASRPWPSNFLKRIRYTDMEHRVNGQIRPLISCKWILGRVAPCRGTTGREVLDG